MTPWYKVFRTVEQARKQLEEFERMNLDKQYAFLYRVVIELAKIDEDVNAERNKFGPLSTPLKALKKEYDDLTWQLRQQYISRGIAWNIEIPSDEHVQRLYISELRSMIENMRQKVTESGTIPDVEEPIHSFVVAFMAPASPPPRLPIPEETEETE